MQAPTRQMTGQAGWMQEMRYFYINLATRRLSPYEQVIWFYLMHRANNAFWKFPLVFSTNEIAGAIGISPSTFRRVREQLVEHRCIYYEQREGEKTARYYIFSQVNPGTLIGNVKRQDRPSDEDLQQGKVVIPKPEWPEIPTLSEEEVRAIAEKSLASAPGCKETAVEAWQRLNGAERQQEPKQVNTTEPYETYETERGYFSEKYGRFPRSKTESAN